MCRCPNASLPGGSEPPTCEVVKELCRLAWFERSFQTKTPSYSEIKRDKLLADMRNNKKFKELLKKYY